MKQLQNYGTSRFGSSGQRGGLTIFTAVLVLILMTLMLVYATRVSVYETRVSGNEVRQKQAFHVAEAAVDQGIMYVLSNASLILSNKVDPFADGRNGWFSAGNTKWAPCPSPAADTHPCGGGVAATANSFYYDTDGDTATIESLPVGTIDFPPGSNARLSALLCYINDITNPTVCSATLPTTSEEEGNASLALTLLAYGYSDCTNPAVSSTCTGEATVALPVSSFKKFGGSPAVPLVTKSTFPPSGTGELVGNPNGGGIGVPLTAWVNENLACPPATSIADSGSWQTCELQEWYHTAEPPPGTTCTDNNCMCGPGGNDTDYFLSWRSATTHIDFDIVTDPLFPCDLFEFYFNYPRALYPLVKNQATIYSDCSSLGPYSSGLIWISGAECRLTANTIVGSPQAPIILVSAASNTVLAGGVTIHGVLYVFDGEDSSADLSTLGSAAVYGAVIVDATMAAFGGTFQIVYAEGTLANARGIGGVGAVNGGWRDFGLPEIAWP